VGDLAAVYPQCTRTRGSQSYPKFHNEVGV
jgi:hypothetical protein